MHSRLQCKSSSTWFFNLKHCNILDQIIIITEARDGVPYKIFSSIPGLHPYMPVIISIHELMTIKNFSRYHQVSWSESWGWIITPLKVIDLIIDAVPLYHSIFIHTWFWKRKKICHIHNHFQKLAEAHGECNKYFAL